MSNTCQTTRITEKINFIYLYILSKDNIYKYIKLLPEPPQQQKKVKKVREKQNHDI